MKKYIMATATVTLFLSAQLVSMDRNPSAEGITVFKNFLASKLTNEQALFLGNEQFPELHNNVLTQWRTHILDMLQKYHIDRVAAKNLFFNMVREAIVQVIASRNPDYTMETVQDLYDKAYLHDVTLVTLMIFG